MPMATILEDQRKALIAERDTLTADPAKFDEVAEARTTEITAKVKDIDARISDLDAEEARDNAAAEARKARPEVKSEPNPVYRKEDLTGPSFFRDLFSVQTNQPEARQASERLVKAQETRALTTAAAAGGTFAPPAWLVDEFVALARPARVTADLVAHEDLPAGVSSINLPVIASGTTQAVVVTQNTAVSNTDITTTSVSSGITTIAGQQVVSLQLLRQSGVPFDRVILQDLALAYAAQLDAQVIAGTGSSGQLLGLVNAGTTVTYTSSAPKVIDTTTSANSFYGKIINAAATMANTRYLPADAIVMTPLRWGWVLEAADDSSRPLVVPNGPQFNGLGVTGDPVAQGMAGTLAGLPVYVDPNIPQTIGVATNEDYVLVLRRGDHWLYETALEATSWDATYANQNSILFRVLGFAAFLTRYAASAQIIGGTGLTAPSL